jgi:hypothetical protein
LKGAIGDINTSDFVVIAGSMNARVGSQQEQEVAGNKVNSKQRVM